MTAFDFESWLSKTPVPAKDSPEMEVVKASVNLSEILCEGGMQIVPQDEKAEEAFIRWAISVSKYLFEKGSANLAQEERWTKS